LLEGSVNFHPIISNQSRIVRNAFAKHTQRGIVYRKRIVLHIQSIRDSHVHSRASAAGVAHIQDHYLLPISKCHNDRDFHD